MAQMVESGIAYPCPREYASKYYEITNLCGDRLLENGKQATRSSTLFPVLLSDLLGGRLLRCPSAVDGEF